MALAVRTERTAVAARAAVARTRVHGEAPVRSMVKTTAAVAHVRPRPQLVVVAPRRRAARLVAVGLVVVFGAMLGAAAFQTQLARRQLVIDSLDQRIRTAHEQYDVLRRERAELRSPGRLTAEATKLGMHAATQTEFVSIPPDVIATVQRSGAPDEHRDTSIEQEFAEYASVKAQAGGAP